MEGGKTLRRHNANEIWAESLGGWIQLTGPWSPSLAPGSAADRFALFVGFAAITTVAVCSGLPQGVSAFKSSAVTRASVKARPAEAVSEFGELYA